MEIVMRLKIALVGLFLLAGVVEMVVAQSTPSLQGVWRITEVTYTGDDAGTNKSPQPGLYIFTKQHYSGVWINTPSARKDFGNAANPAKLTDAEKIARYDVWNAFSANSGTYQVSGTTLTVRPIVAKNPSVMGPALSREFKIEGNTLTLVQKSAAGQPVSQTTTRLTRIE
jgi:hypothetical protein